MLEDLKVWKSITIPAGENLEQLIAALEEMEKDDEAHGEKGGAHIDHRYLQHLQRKFRRRDSERQVDLVRCTPRDLGFEEGRPKACAVYAQAVRRGLKLCPFVLGAYLRLEFRDQRKGDAFWLATKQFPWKYARYRKAILCIPYIANMHDKEGDSLWLYASAFHPKSERDLDDHFVFVK